MDIQKKSVLTITVYDTKISVLRLSETFRLSYSKDSLRNILENKSLRSHLEFSNKNLLRAGRTRGRGLAEHVIPSTSPGTEQGNWRSRGRREGQKFRGTLGRTDSGKPGKDHDKLGGKKALQQ